ncbi:Uncharacterised protein [Vibrio cholerae]|nr:Uncharacterised protein [Vibrio cholerae]CSI96656.1 Uncharacterised protein [Vibrio cholerae]
MKQAAQRRSVNALWRGCKNKRAKPTKWQRPLQSLKSVPPK